jgi:hypothetical protein
MPVLCPICNDRGHKGKRAAFKFDGDITAYNCFNCGPESAAVYDPDGKSTTGEPLTSISRKMEAVLGAFGIPSDQYNMVLLNNLQRISPTTAPNHRPHIRSLEPPTIDLPKWFYPLSGAPDTDKWAHIARYYLDERGINPDSYPFMLSHKTTTKSLHKWHKRLIIPIYKDRKLIYYQGRALVHGLKKYENPAIDRSKVLYGYDEINKRSDAPVYVTEGWFDGYSIGGVAILGNNMNSDQIEILNRSRRRKVFIPDRFGNGRAVALIALTNGWDVSTPDIGDCKDMNEAVNKYGKMYVIKTLTENTINGFEAEAQLHIYCDS